jgi:cob(I)alamin adenosyltransferase
MKKPKLKKGLVQVYTGNGKGKTTASLGLALRASGAGLKVYIMQFLKGKPYSEKNALRKIKNVTIERCGKDCFIVKKANKVDIKQAKNGLEKAIRKISSGRYDLVILDEAIIAVDLGLIKLEELLKAVRQRPDFVEIVLTGRYCPRGLIKEADLVTKMVDIKHPFSKDIKARRGIEY